MIIQIAIFIIGELIALLLFRAIDRFFRRKGNLSAPYRTDYIAIFKGLLERGFIYLCLLHNLPHALTVFGALKIGTRLDDDKKHQVSNDYFFIGNIISVLIAILYYLLASRWIS